MSTEDDNEQERITIPLSAFGAVLSNQLSALDDRFVTADREERLYGYVAALAYLIKQLKAYPGFEGGTVILDDLLVKLTDLLAGTPSLKPVKVRGRPRDGWRGAIIQGRAAACVDLLIERGESESDACKAVADALAKADTRGRRGDRVTAATVRDWCSRASRHGDKPDALAVRQGISILRELTPAELSKFQLRRVVAAFVTSGAAFR